MAEVCAISCILCVVFMFWAAIKNTDPKRAEKLRLLNEKKAETIKKLLPILIEQTIWLNSNLKARNITAEYYSQKMAVVVERFQNCGINPNIIGILPTVNIFNAREIFLKQIRLANSLDDTNEISKEEFEKLINESLDVLNGLK